MRIATWNVNSLTARHGHVLRWLAQQQQAGTPVDALGLQELKLTDDKFPFDALQAAGYAAASHGQKTYNGVAWLSRLGAPRDVLRGIPGFADEQARLIATTLETPSGPLRLVNGYFVNGQAPGSDKFEYKMSWLRALRDWLREELALHPHLVLLGDFNIAPEDRDSYDPQGLRETIHHTSAERDHFRHLLGLGLVDAFRLFEQPAKNYSWWDYRQLGYQKNRGLRIDHVLVSEALQPLVRACSIDRAPRKWDKPSDHAPVVVDIDI